jgi:GTPase SAR1 family protein
MNNAEAGVVVYLVGNLADTPMEEREVAKEDGVQMMKSLDLNHHIETSAMENHNIDELFITLSRHLYFLNNKNLDAFKDESEVSRA